MWRDSDGLADRGRGSGRRRARSMSPRVRERPSTAGTCFRLPEKGAILGTIESNRFVTGVTWVDGELWHGTWECECRECALRGITGE